MERYGRVEFDISHEKAFWVQKLVLWYWCIGHRGLDGFTWGVWNYQGQMN
jgi:hypothetical protein